jgi:hypothetical protein
METISINKQGIAGSYLEMSEKKLLKRNFTLQEYCPVHKYMRQPPLLSSRVRLLSYHISRVWTLRKVK